MSIFSQIKKTLWSIDNPEEIRNLWVQQKLEGIHSGTILDAGCGTQPYRKFCNHLSYKSQDFGEYDGEGNGEGLQNKESWRYGDIDYKGNIWKIEEKDDFFDAILCSEVIEHIPYPNETFNEFSRLLKKGGKLILTAPYACLPHMQPYFFYSGFSEDYYKHVAQENGFKILECTQNGNTFTFIFQELKRSYELIDCLPLRVLFAIMFLTFAPFLKYLSKKCKKKTALTFGYMLVMEKL